LRLKAQKQNLHFIYNFVCWVLVPQHDGEFQGLSEYDKSYGDVHCHLHQHRHYRHEHEHQHEDPILAIIRCPISEEIAKIRLWSKFYVRPKEKARMA
jgi:hypothetical protein